MQFISDIKTELDANVTLACAASNGINREEGANLLLFKTPDERCQLRKFIFRGNCSWVDEARRRHAQSRTNSLLGRTQQLHIRQSQRPFLFQRLDTCPHLLFQFENRQIVVELSTVTIVKSNR